MIPRVVEEPPVGDLPSDPVLVDHQPGQRCGHRCGQVPGRTAGHHLQGQAALLDRLHHAEGLEVAPGPPPLVGCDL